LSRKREETTHNNSNKELRRKKPAEAREQEQIHRKPKL
jgi:hypothetical protein